MLFNSIGFLYLFLPITYLVFWSLRTKNQRYVWLTISGYAFYSFWNYKFCALMAFSTACAYLAGLGFSRWEDRRRRRWCLVLPITVDLLLLGFFKYANFAVDTFGDCAKWLHHPVHLKHLAIVLPVGISFYTFHTITYVVDCYRRTIRPTRNPFEFSCYVSLFAQLVAGPIVRFRQIENDLEHLDEANRRELLPRGWSFFALGMIKKVLIADTIAAYINPELAHVAALSTAGAWLSMLGYSYQLYFDFSGYSDMAVGLGQMFGLRLPQNFNSPYRALDIADFWKRWHMSLSSVLRDYLYIPLGGNRGAQWMTYRNLLVTMLLGGLWHGANWTFVIWGGFHGLLLVAHQRGKAGWERLPTWARQAGTFFLVLVGWVFFRSDDLAMAKALLVKMFFWQPVHPFPSAPRLTLAIGVAAVVAHVLPNTFELNHRWKPWVNVTLAVAFALCIFRMYGRAQSPFLYFQF